MEKRQHSFFGTTYVKSQAKPIMSTCCQTYIPEEEAILNHGMCNECMDKAVEESNERTVKQANNQVCICPKHLRNIVYTDSIDAGNEERDRLDGYYCANCNSFWREL